MFKEILRWIVEVIIILMPLVPILIQSTKLIGQRTRNQNMVNLASRAEIIVTALEQTPYMNEEKKQLGIEKLKMYANEVGINLTKEQAEDYIESAVNLLKQFQSPEVEVDLIE